MKMSNDIFRFSIHHFSRSSKKACRKQKIHLVKRCSKKKSRFSRQKTGFSSILIQLCYDKIEWVIPDWKTDLNVLQVIPDKAEKKSRSSFVVSGLLLNQQQEFHRFEQMQVKGRDGYLENSRESSHPDRQQRCFPEQKFYALEILLLQQDNRRSGYNLFQKWK